jgi:hypothetical protein
LIEKNKKMTVTYVLLDYKQMTSVMMFRARMKADQMLHDKEIDFNINYQNLIRQNKRIEAFMLIPKYIKIVIEYIKNIWSGIDKSIEQINSDIDDKTEEVNTKFETQEIEIAHLKLELKEQKELIEIILQKDN